MTKIKTVPNQLVIKVNTEKCGNGKLFAQIDMEALNEAARRLEAGAFKLWIYFSKNQNGYEFALSSKAVEEEFGMKIKQYTNAKNKLIEAGYLTETSSNHYTFSQIPVIPKGNNENKENAVNPKGNNDVIPKGNKDVITKSNNALLPKDTRNITPITSTTINNTSDDNYPTITRAECMSLKNKEIIDATKGIIKVDNDKIYRVV